MRGKLIVIEGLDGSGKSTQLGILDANVSSLGFSTRQIKLPNYEDPSSELVKMYLNGRFGKEPGDVNVYAASSFFAVDRYVSYNCYWKNDYQKGKVILADRYTTSNAYHQMTKLPEEKWDSFLTWLEDYEYHKLGIPSPDAVIYLDVPVELSQSLMSKRYKGDEVKKDIHEKNIKYLKRCRDAALYAVEKLGWHRVVCHENDSMRRIEDIAEEISLICSKELGKNA